MSLVNFHELVNQTRMDKFADINHVNRLQSMMPKLNSHKNTEMQYYKNLEKYEIIQRNLLKLRIKNLLMVQKISPKKKY